VAAIKVTREAIAEIKKLDRCEKPGGTMRLVAGPFGRLQFVTDYDRDWSRDEVITDGGEAVLLVDKELAASLNGIVIDYQESRGGLCLRRDKNAAA